MDELELLRSRLAREREARKQAESLLEARSRELFETNEQLRLLNNTLEERVEERAQQVHKANTLLQEEIEERNRAEAQLRLTQATVDRAADAIFWVDSSGRYVYVNDSGCRLLGYHREDILTLRVYEVELGLTSDRWSDHWNQLRDRLPTTGESRIINSSRDVFPAEVTSSFIDYSGRRYLCQHVRDITERKDSERRLRQARIRFETLINSLQGGVLVEDESRSIVLVNQSFCEMFGIGIAANLLVGMDSRTTYTELRNAFTSPDECQSRIEEVIENREIVVSEKLRLADGRILERDYVPIFFDRNYLGHFWHYRDITEEERTHEILVETLADTAGRTGFEFFQALTSSLARVIGVHWVDVFEVLPDRVTTLANYPPEDADRLPLEILLKLQTQDVAKSCLLIAPLTESDGTTIGYLTVRDDRRIRERELADTTLRIFAERAAAELRRMRTEEENTKLAVVAARTDNAVTIMDRTGRIEYINEGYERMTGYPRDEVLGKSSSSFLQGAETDPDTVEFMRQSIADGTAFRAEVLRYSRSGRKYWVAIEGQPIVDNKGFQTRFMTIETEITDRKRNEMRLRMQGEVLEQVARGRPLTEILNTLCQLVEVLIESSACTVLSITPDATELEVVSAPAFASSLNQQRVALQLIHGNGSAVESVLTNKPTFVADCLNDERWQLARGFAETYNLKASWAHPIQVEQETFGAFAITRSVTGLPLPDQIVMLEIAANLAGIAMKRHRDASALEGAVIKAESASRAKSEFLANMSHELRTPLTAITGYADLLAPPENRTEQDSRWAHQILKSAQHLGMLLDDLLDLSKVEAGRLTVEMHPCDVISIVEEVSSLFRPRATEKLLGFVVRSEPQVPRWIMSDPTRLRQIVTNFVSNAIKFTQRGEVRVLVECSNGKAGDTPEEIRVSVVDSGVGMNADQIALLFQPFQRVHRASLQVGGTGLGLAISKRLAELMGGRIEILSTPEVGTTFTFILPIVPVPVERTDHKTGAESMSFGVSSSGAPSPFRGRRILIVDDNSDNVAIFTHLLEPLEADLLVASNGQQAIDLVEQQARIGQAVQIVLMDMQMPILDGFQATAELRRRGFTIPIVALTAFAMQSDQERCRSAGCDLFLAKPVRRKTLLGIINQALDLVIKHENESAGITLQDPTGAIEGRTVESDSSAVIEPMTGTPNTQQGFDQLLSQYRRSLHRYLKLIDDNQTTGDPMEICQVTHRLKGTGSNFGFPRITEVAGACEDQLRNGKSLADIAKPLEELKELLKAAING